MKVFAELDGTSVVNLYDPAAQDIPQGAVEMDADREVLVSVESPSDLMVDGDTLAVDPAKVAERSARKLRPLIKRRLRRLLKQKIMQGTGIDSEDELILAIALAPQAVKDRIQRVRTRLSDKDAEIDAMDEAQLAALDPETAVDWS